jgi:CRISPR/Cas system CSM-associated protein Csm5 (group 7 of RAMP superfamily)
MQTVYIIMERTPEGDRIARIAGTADKANAIMNSYIEFPELALFYYIERWEVEL